MLPRRLTHGVTRHGGSPFLPSKHVRILPANTPAYPGGAESNRLLSKQQRRCNPGGQINPIPFGLTGTRAVLSASGVQSRRFSQAAGVSDLVSINPSPVHSSVKSALLAIYKSLVRGTRVLIIQMLAFKD